MVRIARPTILERIVSGGQTGVDRAALDAALACGLPIGGWCPKGRRSEDGVIPDRYPLVETPSRGYRQRTTWNVRDSDATLGLGMGLAMVLRELDGGSKFTTVVAARLQKPHLVMAVDTCDTNAGVLYWLAATKPSVLNIAGPRESRRPGIYQLALCFLVDLFTMIDRD